MLVQDWTSVLVVSFQGLWTELVSRFLPYLVGATVVFIIGLIVASALKYVVERIIRALKVDSLLKNAGVGQYFDRGGLRLDTGMFFGGLVYWFVVIAFLVAATNILGLSVFSSFLQEVVFYIPSIALAVLTMVLTVLVASFLRRVVKSSLMSARLHAAKFLGTLAWWSVIVFGFLAALNQLGVAQGIIQIVITGAVGMFAIAGGIAFGLGGKDYANHLLERFRDQVENR